jgi:hypothetical protein
VSIKRLRLAALICLTVAATFRAASPARADLTETVGSGFGANLALIPSFDTSLGTLDSVSVSINGLLDLTLETSLNLVPSGAGPVPVPYPISGLMNLSFSGAAFNSQPPGAVYFINGLADGLGDPTDIYVPINIDFDFTAVTDLTGFTVSNVPGGIFSGTRADFAPVPASIPLPELDMPTYIDMSQQPDTLINWDLDGGVLVQYSYTPPSAASVPEPPSLLLIAAGAVLLVGRRRFSVLRA